MNKAWNENSAQIEEKDKMVTNKRLTRSRDDKMLGGVCGGLGAYFELDSTLIRILFALLIVFGMGSPILLYLLLWVIIPGANSQRALLTESGGSAQPETDATLQESAPVTNAPS